jgi:protein SCO1
MVARRLLTWATLLTAPIWLHLPAPAAGRSVGAVASAAVLMKSVPNVRVRTQNNQEVRFYDDLIKGKIVIMNFMFTTCTTLCPRGTPNLVNVQQALGEHMGRDVFMISVSVDPEHDTPDVLKDYADRYHAGAGWVFVTGALEDIDLIRRNVGVVRDDEDRTQHTGMLIYGDDARRTWAATPILGNAPAIARSVLRLVALSGM